MCFSTASTLQLPKKVPKNILSIFFPCIFYGITEWNSLQILQLKSIFKAHKYSSGSASNVEFFVCFQMPKWGRGGGVGGGGGGEGRGGRGWISLNHWYVQKLSGFVTVKCFIGLGLDPTRGFNALLWTTTPKVTCLRKLSGHFIPRHCSWSPK